MSFGGRFSPAMKFSDVCQFVRALNYRRKKGYTVAKGPFLAKEGEFGNVAIKSLNISVQPSDQNSQILGNLEISARNEVITSITGQYKW